MARLAVHVTRRVVRGPLPRAPHHLASLAVILDRAGEVLGDGRALLLLELGRRRVVRDLPARLDEDGAWPEERQDVLVARVMLAARVELHVGAVLVPALLVEVLVRLRDADVQPDRALLCRVAGIVFVTGLEELGEGLLNGSCSVVVPNGGGDQESCTLQEPATADMVVPVEVELADVVGHHGTFAPILELQIGNDKTIRCHSVG